MKASQISNQSFYSRALGNMDVAPPLRCSIPEKSYDGCSAPSSLHPRHRVCPSSASPHCFASRRYIFDLDGTLADSMCDAPACTPLPTTGSIVTLCACPSTTAHGAKACRQGAAPTSISRGRCGNNYRIVVCTGCMVRGACMCI